MPDLSVIIVSYNTCELLAACLQSVFAARPTGNGLEVIVVDNGSSDGSADMVRQRFPQVRLAINPGNRGFSAANNQGAQQAAGRYLLFLNSDTELGHEALVNPVNYILQNPAVGALTVRLVYPSGERDPDNHRGFPTPWTALCHFIGLDRLFQYSPFFNNYYQSYRDFDQVHVIDVAAGSYLMMPTDLFRELGGWDESYFFYGEDIDLCYRIQAAGYLIIYYPEVEVVHHKGASSGLRKEAAGIARASRETRVRAARESVRAMSIFYQKYYRPKYPRWLTAVVLAGIYVMGRARILKHQLT